MSAVEVYRAFLLAFVNEKSTTSAVLIFVGWHHPPFQGLLTANFTKGLGSQIALTFAVLQYACLSLSWHTYIHIHNRSLRIHTPSSLFLCCPVAENGAGDTQRSSSPANYVRNVSTPTSTAYIQQPTAESSKYNTESYIHLTPCTPCTHTSNSDSRIGLHGCMSNTYK